MVATIATTGWSSSPLRSTTYTTGPMLRTYRIGNAIRAVCKPVPKRLSEWLMLGLLAEF